LPAAVTGHAQPAHADRVRVGGHQWPAAPCRSSSWPPRSVRHTVSPGCATAAVDGTGRRRPTTLRRVAGRRQSERRRCRDRRAREAHAVVSQRAAGRPVAGGADRGSLTGTGRCRTVQIRQTVVFLALLGSSAVQGGVVREWSRSHIGCSAARWWAANLHSGPRKPGRRAPMAVVME